jgi:hypothetical protein
VNLKLLYVVASVFDRVRRPLATTFETILPYKVGLIEYHVRILQIDNGLVVDYQTWSRERCEFDVRQGFFGQLHHRLTTAFGTILPYRLGSIEYYM